MELAAATGHSYRLVWGEPYGDRDAATGTVTPIDDRHVSLRTDDGRTYLIDTATILSEQEIPS